MLFSIIVPCHNVINRIKDLFKMLADRLYTNYEVVFVDDCSSDGSFIYMQNNNPMPDHFKIVQTEVNLGPGGARNKGLSCAKGDFILFLDSDDFFDLHILQYMEKIIGTDCDCDAVVFPFFSCNKNKKEKKIDLFPDYSEGGVIPASIAVTDSGMVWSKLFRRSIIEENGVLFPQTKIGEDRVFWTRYCCFARKILKSDRPFYKYIRTSTSITHTIRKENIEDVSAFEFLQPLYSDFFQEVETLMFVNAHLLHYAKQMCDQGFSTKEIKQWFAVENKRYPNWIRHMNLKSQSIYRKCIYIAMYYNRPVLIKSIMFIRRILY